VTTAEALATVRAALTDLYHHTLERDVQKGRSDIWQHGLAALARLEACIAERQDTIDELLARNGDLERELETRFWEQSPVLATRLRSDQEILAAESRIAAYERVVEAASVQPGSDLTSVGHWTGGGTHWYDPRSTPMPGCALCAALAALKEQA
jgi:hypothetical protein